MAFPVIYDPQIFPPPDEGGGGGGTGTVTSIGATPPINVSPSPITTSGLVGHDTSGVTPGSYTSSNITVDSFGHVTSAASGTAGTSLAVKDEGVLLTSAATVMDFVGSAVTATAVGTVVTVSIVDALSMFPLFGDGQDGAVLLDGTNTFTWATKVGSVYSMTDSVMATTLTINAGVELIPGGWGVLCTSTATINGKITANGNPGTGGGSGGVGTNYVAGNWVFNTGATSSGGGGAGGVGPGGVGVAGGTLTNPGMGGNGGAGGAGTVSAGGAGGLSTRPTPAQGGVRLQSVLWAMQAPGHLISTVSGRGGGGGGGGGWDGGHAGGAGGAGGGVMVMCLHDIAGSGSIELKGGNGSFVFTGCGTGGGGGGGFLRMITTTTGWKSVGVTVSVAGGVAAAATGGGTTGTNGVTGTIIEYVVAP